MGREGSRCTVYSATMRGNEAVLMDVEVVVGGVIPAFLIVGMPDKVITDTRERVRSAICASGFFMPDDRVVANLTPNNLRPIAPVLDLAIAAALLVATGQIESDVVEDALLVGELSLCGEVRLVPHMEVYELLARDQGLTLVCAPEGEGPSLAKGLIRHCVSSLSELCAGTHARHAGILPRGSVISSATTDLSATG